MKWWSDCPKEEHNECRLLNKKIKWMKNGYSWGFITWVDYCNIRDLLEKEIDRIEEKYGDGSEDYEEQYTLF